MTTELICTLVTAGGTLLSAVIAFFVSRSTANKEIEKMKLSWDHEDTVSSDDDFAEMAALVSKFVCLSTGGWQPDALSKVAEVRSRESGRLGDILDKLYVCIGQEHYRETDALLTEAITEKRKLKSKRKTK